MKKPFKETKLAKFFTEKHPDLLKNIATGIDIADEFIPPLKIATAVINATGISKEDKDEAMTVVSEYEGTEYRDWLADLKDARAANIAIQTSEKVPMIVKLRPTIIAFMIIFI